MFNLWVGRTKACVSKNENFQYIEVNLKRTNNGSITFEIVKKIEEVLNSINTFEAIGCSRLNTARSCTDFG